MNLKIIIQNYGLRDETKLFVFLKCSITGVTGVTRMVIRVTGVMRGMGVMGAMVMRGVRISY